MYMYSINNEWSIVLGIEDKLEIFQEKKCRKILVVHMATSPKSDCPKPFSCCHGCLDTQFVEPCQEVTEWTKDLFGVKHHNH